MHPALSLLLTCAVALAVLLSGCGMLSGVKPQRGGGASAQLGGTSAPTAVTIAQPENPSTASSQTVERQETRQTVVPVPVVKVTETPQLDGSVVRVTEQFSSQVVTSTTKEQTKSEIGAAQKDNAREVSAKLAAMRPVQFAGIAALALAVAMFHPVVRIALGGGKTLQMYVAGAGLVLIFGPSVVVGNENLLLIGTLVLGGAVWGLSRLSHKEGQLDALRGPKP